jgi:hypothetical protein
MKKTLLLEMFIKISVFVVVGYTAIITIYSTFKFVGINGLQLQISSAALLLFYFTRPNQKTIKWDRPVKKALPKQESPNFKVSPINQ